MGRNRFEAESWARTIKLPVYEMERKAAEVKKDLKVAVRRILALEVICLANTDWP